MAFIRARNLHNEPFRIRCTEIYLFEHGVDEDIDIVGDREALIADLRIAGFEDEQVARAMDWLQGHLLQIRTISGRDGAPIESAIRVFTRREQCKLNVESRGFLMFLERMGVLNSPICELVIDRVLALETDKIDLNE